MLKLLTNDEVPQELEPEVTQEYQGLKVQVSIMDLVNGWKRLKHVLPTRTSEPVFTYVRLTLEAGIIRMEGTDNLISSSEEIRPAGVDRGGSIAIQGTLLNDILAGFIDIAEDELEILEGENFGITFWAGQTRFEVRGESPKNLPIIKDMRDDAPLQRFQVSASELKLAIKEGVEIVKVGGGSQTFEDVLFESSLDKVNLVATDSVRIALRTLNVDVVQEEDMHSRVPMSGLLKLAKMLPNRYGGNVECANFEDCMRFQFQHSTVLIRKSDKTFPSYRQIIPKEHRLDVTINTGKLKKACKGLKGFAQRGSKGKVTLALRDGELYLDCCTPEIGTASKKLPCHFSGDGGEFAFNIKFLLDFLERVSTEYLQIGLTSSIYPATFEPVNEYKEDTRQGDLTYVLMPINL